MARQVRAEGLPSLREEVIRQGIDQKFAPILGLLDAQLMLGDTSSSFWVNNGENITTIVVTKEDKMFGYVVYSTDADDLRNVILNVVDWSQRIQYTTFNKWSSLLEELTQTQVPDFKKEIHFTGHVYAATAETLVMPPVPPGYTLHKLTLSDAREVNARWDLGEGETSLSLVESQIRMFPSVCARDAEGRLAAFELVSPMLGMTMLYTYPEHRCKGLAAAVKYELGRQLIDLRGISFLHVEIGNHISAVVQRKCGFSILGERNCMLLYVPREKQPQVTENKE